jgi:hypothetical protein
MRKTPIFSPKIVKIAENCDHNIDPSVCIIPEREQERGIFSFFVYFSSPSAAQLCTPPHVTSR